VVLAQNPALAVQGVLSQLASRLYLAQQAQELAWIRPNSAVSRHHGVNGGAGGLVSGRPAGRNPPSL